MSSRAASSPAAANRSITSPASTAPPITCRTAASMSRDPAARPSLGPASSASRLRIIAATRWKNARCGAIVSRLRARHGQGERRRQPLDHPAEPLPARLLPDVVLHVQHVVDRAEVHPQHVRRLRVQRRRVVAAVEERPQLLERRPHRRDRLVLQLPDRLVRLARRVRVRRQRIGQRVGQPDQVDDQPAGLLAVDAVHAGDRLHQVVPGQRLVEVHRVRAAARRSPSATCPPRSPAGSRRPGP